MKKKVKEEKKKSNWWKWVAVLIIILALYSMNKEDEKDCIEDCKWDKEDCREYSYYDYDYEDCSWEYEDCVEDCER